MDKVFVFASGIAINIFILWFFLGKKESAVMAGDSLEVVVEGGYIPDVIELKKGKKTTIEFFRKDPSDCLEEIVIPEFKIRKSLPLNKKSKVEITPTKEGEFEFTCGMNMFHGKIKVKE